MKLTKMTEFIKKVVSPKNKKIWLKRIILFCSFLLLFLACKWVYCFFEGMYPNPDCATVQEAKERGVLLYMYKINPESFTLPDGSRVSLKEVWVEKAWRYTNLCKDEFEIVPDAFNFNITFNGKQIEKINKLFGYNWYFVRGNDKFYSADHTGDGKGNDRVKMYENIAYPTDTLRLIVIKGSNNSEQNNIIKGVFTVQKTSSWR